jgi:hypothetical protein
MWIAAIDEPSDPATLEVVAATGERASVATWDQVVSGGNHSVSVRRVPLPDLAPRSRRRVELQRGGEVLATATAGTLPDRLPGLDEQPFTMLVGSCFARGQDGAGNVGRAYSLLAEGVRPDLKVLCGDQVYLDAPSFWTVFPSVTKDELRRRLLEIYIAAWTQDPGFHQLLAHGPNLFTSDDHDYWNNAPHWSVTAPATLVPELRCAWWEAATDLYRAFQRPMPPSTMSLDMEGLSLCVTDTRANRTESQDAVFTDTDLDDLTRWADGLKTPGCLVAGQLLFSGQAGWMGRFSDWGLPDFKQYPRLLHALAGAKHSIIVLTGDVHFGRVAVCELASGSEIVEVVASPLALVAKVPRNDWRAAPALYPAEAVPGRIQRPIRTEGSYQLNANHFATIELKRGGDWVRMRVRAWPTELNGRLPMPTREYVHWLA